MLTVDEQVSITLVWRRNHEIGTITWRDAAAREHAAPACRRNQQAAALLGAGENPAGMP
jgi:hypothetical protein